MDDLLKKVLRFEKQRVDKDGYINTEIWYSKLENGKLKEEQESHAVELNGRSYPIISQLEREYAEQEERSRRTIEELKRRFPQLNSE